MSLILSKTYDILHSMANNLQQHTSTESQMLELNSITLFFISQQCTRWAELCSTKLNWIQLQIVNSVVLMLAANALMQMV